MSGRRPRWATWVLLTLSLLAAGTAPAAEPEAAPTVTVTDNTFPEVGPIEGNVTFWIRAFSEWTLGQAAIHDLDHPQLVYEVVDLPGVIAGSYTKQQREYLEQVRERWEDYLYHLEKKAGSGQALSDIDNQWLAHITEAIGAQGLKDAHERVRSQRGMRERFRGGLERAGRYDAAIREIFRSENLPEDLAFLPHVESSFQYHAKSSVGATGLWQFTRGTGRLYMTINSAIDERLDAIAATRGAAGYLRDAYKKLGNWPLALTSYNHGVQGMLRAREKHGANFGDVYLNYRGRSFGFASKNFYAEFLAAREIAMHVEHYFPEGFTLEPALSEDHVVLEQRASARTLALTYDVPLDELARLNPAWSSRVVSRGSALPAGIQVWLPAGTLERLAREGRPNPLPISGWTDEGQYYVVQRGDTLSEIARAHGVTIAELRDLNDISRSSSLIHVGQKLLVNDSVASPMHVVAKGQSLSTIAVRYGTTVQALREMNGIPSSSSLIRPGQMLILDPTVTGGVHVVERGETLSEIASTYRVTLSALRGANGIASNSSMIRVGQELMLPGGANPREDKQHVVRRGDTLIQIATRYGVKLRDLLNANTLRMNSLIHPGQTLLIPPR